MSRPNCEAITSRSSTNAPDWRRDLAIAELHRDLAALQSEVRALLGRDVITGAPLGLEHSPAESRLAVGVTPSPLAEGRPEVDDPLGLCQLCGPVSHDEAEEIATRFINRAFNNPGKERPRMSIPTDCKRDDDVRLIAYIIQQRAVNPSPPAEDAKGAAPPKNATEEWVRAEISADHGLFVSLGGEGTYVTFDATAKWLQDTINDKLAAKEEEVEGLRRQYAALNRDKGAVEATFEMMKSDYEYAKHERDAANAAREEAERRLVDIERYEWNPAIDATANIECIRRIARA